MTPCVGGRRFIIEPIVKPLGMCLHPASCHHPSTHCSWPLAYIASLAARSSTMIAFQNAKSQFLNKLVRSGFPFELVDAISTYTNFTKVGIITPRPRELQPTTVTRIVVPYHPVWQKFGVVGATLRKFGSCDLYPRLLRVAFNGLPVDVQVAWKIVSVPLAQSWLSWR